MARTILGSGGHAGGVGGLPGGSHMVCSPIEEFLLALAAAVAGNRLPVVPPHVLVILAVPPALHLRLPVPRRRSLPAAHQLSGRNRLTSHVYLLSRGSKCLGDPAISAPKTGSNKCPTNLLSCRPLKTGGKGHKTIGLQPQYEVTLQGLQIKCSICNTAQA